MLISARTPATAARSLLMAAGRNPSEHTILEENLTTMLGHFKTDFVGGLEDVPPEKRLEALNGCYANGPINLALKISREIRQQPYTDPEVHQRLDHLEETVRGTTRRLLEENSGFPCRIYVAGSLLKGRFGANSDLDLLVAASPEWMAKNFWEVGMQHDVSIQCLQGDAQQQADKIESFGKTLEVSPEQLCEPGFLHGLFRQGHEAKGFTLEDGHLVATGPIRRELEPDKGDWGMGGMV